ncbi:MAG: hypothetical protein FWH31_11305 [Streptococcaceae bacterium]|nr:hypothetical protein [Streptococcaceae bacterium]
MTIEKEFREEGLALQREFAILERMINENEIEMATEELSFAKMMLTSYIEKIKTADGEKIGVIGKIFRHPYHVPEEFMKIVIAMVAKEKQLSKQLNKKQEKQHNQANREAARNRRAGKNAN